MSTDTSIISGDLTGSVTVTNDLYLLVEGDVTSSSTIVAEYMSELYIGVPNGTFAGRLEVLGGHANIAIGTLTGIIDYNDHVLYGELGIHRGRSGQIINGGVIQASTSVVLTTSSAYAFSGTATFAGAVDSALTPWISCPKLTGTLHITGDMGGVIEGTTSGLASSAIIQIDGDLGGAIRLTGAGTAEGEIRIGGDVLSLVDDQSIEIAGTLGGNSRIRINGSLSSLYASDTIQLGAMADTAALTVDFDGDDFGDYWGEAGVRIGSTLYTSNSPDAALWDVTSCRGDMNNDGEVNNFDIDPFVLALVDPAGYEDEFPGLEGSRVYHGDCNCDGLLNSFDIDPFVGKVVNGCCESTCPGCSYFARGGGPDASEIAAILAENVASDRFEALLDIVNEVAAGEEPNAEFWGEVLEALGG